MKLYEFLKKLVISGFTLFTFNMMINPLNIVIPINIYTIIFTYLFGIMSLPFFTILLMFFK